jgi:hypothetical protein
MPAIRDSTWNATSGATGTTLVLSVPAYVVGDLLLAVFMADTGTATWTAGAPPSGAGWAHITGSPTTNTCQLVCMWKYAVASEPVSYTFTASGAESFNGAMISVRDTHATTPFGATSVINFTNQASAAKFSMQTITTNVANCLVLYASANSAAGVPSLLEGPVFGLIGADGVAESLGIGWTFKQTAGLTPANVTVSNVTAGAGVKLALQIAPPVAGAAVIPGYVTADSSIYVDPLNGTTAYNTNTAMAATADTNFGTSIGGITTGDATVSAVTDVGINSFHSVARLTTATGVTTPGGAELVLAVANRPNVTGKNVLVHIGPSTEGQLQRFSTIASGRGLWFGMRNAAGNNKVYQVYGAEKGAGRHTPVVINGDATTTKHTAGTLTQSSIQAFGFWVSGTGVTTTAWDFASLWVLDTTTVCGGNTTEPLDISQIYRTVSVGKERKSVLLQGSSQLLILQPLQIGNGGTDPTNLLLDSTAIEFPRQYNSATKDVTYHSVDNVAGITYYAGSTDVIRHVSSVISSASKYHWRIHASSSALATYDFSGLSLIGAGDVQLRAVTTFTGMSFTSCPTITQNGAAILDCTFTNSKVIVSEVGNLDDIQYSSFTKTTGTSHAIEITSIGAFPSITMLGVTYSGYASANGSTGNEAIYVNVATGTVNITISDGGSTPSIRTAGATVNVIAGAVTVTLTVTDTTGTPIEGAQALIKAAAGGPMFVNATVTIVNSGTTATVTQTAHGLATNDKVVIKGASHYQNNGVFVVAVTDANTYTYTMGSAPGSNPTGTIQATFVVISGTTDVNGILFMSRVFASNQPVTGWARKSTASPFYKTGVVSGTVNSTSGAEFTALLIQDE